MKQPPLQMANEVIKAGKEYIEAVQENTKLLSTWEDGESPPPLKPIMPLWNRWRHLTNNYLAIERIADNNNS